MKELTFKLLEMNGGYSILTDDGVELWRCNADEPWQNSFRLEDVFIEVIKPTTENPQFVIGVVSSEPYQLSVYVHTEKYSAIVIYPGRGDVDEEVVYGNPLISISQVKQCSFSVSNT